MFRSILPTAGESPNAVGGRFARVVAKAGEFAPVMIKQVVIPNPLAVERWPRRLALLSSVAHSAIITREEKPSLCRYRKDGSSPVSDFGA